MDAKERFEIGASVGRDELGEVRKATDRESGALVALKIFDPWICALEEGRAAYAEQLEALQKLSLQRTPGIVGWHLDAQQAWLATAWVEGTTLATLLASDEDIEAERALELACGLLLALEELHDGGAVHGGLTPRKVLFAGSPGPSTLVLSDPSQCLLYGVSDPIRTSRAEPDRFLGLPQYFSPEQAQGKPATPASDLYVAALVLYEMLVGKPPFESSAKHTTLRRQIYERPLPVRLARPGLAVHESLDEILLSVLSKEPEKRFGSAAAFREALLSIRASADDAAERAARPLVAAQASVSESTGDVESDTQVAAQAEEGAPAVAEASASSADAKLSTDASAQEDVSADEDEATSGAQDESDSSTESSSRRRKGKRGRRKKKNTSRGEPVAAVAALAGAGDADTDGSSSTDTAESAEGTERAKGGAETSSGGSDADAADESAGGDEHDSWFSIGDDAEKLKAHQTQRIILEQRQEDSRTQRRSVRIAVAVVLALVSVMAVLLIWSGSRGDVAEDLTPPSDSAVLQPPATPAPTPAAPSAEEEDSAAPEAPAPEAAAAADPALEDPAAQVPAPEASAEDEGGAPTGVDAEDSEPVEDDPATEEPVAAPTPPPAPRAEPEPAPSPEPRAAPRTAETVRPAPSPEAPREASAERERSAAAPVPEPAAEEGPSDRERVRQLLRDGSQALSRRDFAQARQHLEAALAIDENSAEVHAVLGDVYFEERDYTSAARHHRRATRLAPRNASYQRKLGMDFFRLGRLENALEAFERAVELGDAEAAEYVRITQRRMEN